MPPRIAVATLFSARRLLEGAADRFLLGLARDHQHALAVAEEEVAGRDAHAADLDRHAKIDDLAARPLVLRVEPAREHRKAERLDLARIADIAVENGAGAP